MVGFLDAAIWASSALAALGVAFLAFGYRGSLFSDDDVTRNFAWSMALLAVTVGGWRLSVPPDVPLIGLALNALTLWAIYLGLRARLLLIPEEERNGWRWWNAWSHPGLMRFRIERNGRK